MLNYAMVALGGALGSVARFWFSTSIAQRFDETFPFGTLFVNITGSFLIGLFAAFSGPDSRWLLSPSARAFFMIGVCGGYTTFSSFSLQNLQLIRDGNWLYASLNAAVSLVFCMLAVWLGYGTGLALNSNK